MFDHERLHVYRVSLEFVAWVFERIGRLSGYLRHARDELIRASQSMPRNIAEGNGKRSRADRKRYFEIARGSGLECASILDELRVMKALNDAEVEQGKGLLRRIVAMLTKMTEPDGGSMLREEPVEYGELDEATIAHRCENEE